MTSLLNSENSSRSPQKTLVSVVVILVIAAIPRLYALSTLPGINADEAYEALTALEIVSGKWQWNPVQPYFGPFYFAFLGYWIKVFGLSTFAIRIIPSLCGIASVLFTLFVVSRVYSWRTGVICATVLASFPAHVAWSRIAFGVSNLPLVNIVIIWFLFLWLKEQRQVCFWAATFFMGVGCNMHPSEFIFVGGLGVAVLWILFGKRRIVPLSELTGPCLLFLILSAPVWLFWINGALGKTTAGIQLLNTSYRSLYFNAFFQVLSGDQIYSYFAGSLRNASKWRMAQDILLAVLLIAGVVRCLVRRNTWDILLSVPAVLFILITFWVGAPIHVLGSERYLLPIFFVLPIFIGLAIDWLVGSKGWIRMVTFCVFLFITAGWSSDIASYYFRYMIQTGGTSEQTFMTSIDHDPKIEASRYIDEQFSPSDVRIYAESWWLYWPARLVLEERFEIHIAPRRTTQFSQLDESGQGKTNIFLVFDKSKLDSYLRKKKKREHLEVLNFTKAGNRNLVRLYW